MTIHRAGGCQCGRAGRSAIAADAKPNIRLKESEQENLRGRALWVQQCRKKDIGVEDNANHCFTG